VESVYWDECQDFLQKLNARVGGKERFRLPTEAEWEWACRAGTKTRFSFGDEEARLAEYGWYFANSGNTTHPVGEKRPNAWGLYDCHGNVWEWCGDWGRTYSANPWPGIFRWTKDPQGRRTTTAPAPNVRGGAWDYGPGNCRSAFREVSQSDRTGHQGLRVAATTGRP
jgi:formylglycine-generating enzyme required for sulfatase activity